MDARTVGNAPRGLAVNPSGTLVYVSNNGFNTVSVISTATNSVIDTITVGNAPYGIAVNSAGTRAYVAHLNSDDVYVINTATNTVVGSPINLGGRLIGISITPDGTRVYVANFDGDNVSVINTATNAVIATIPVGTEPVSLGIFIAQPNVGIPTMNEWGMIIFVVLAGLGAVFYLRRSKRAEN